MIITGILVFLARLIDVSLGTLRIKAMMRGDKLQTCSIAFIEVIIYALAASKAFAYVSNPIVLFSYALGYASGNYLGMIIDEKMSKGTMMLLVIADKNSCKLAETLRSKGYPVTESDGYGFNGSEKTQLLVIVEKQKYKELETELAKHEDGIYTAVLDIKEAFSMNSGVRK